MEMPKLKAFSLDFGVNITHHEFSVNKNKKELFRAVDACATITTIQVDDAHGNFTPQEMQLLQDGRTERNRNLRRFVANPRQLSEKELLVLMLQLKNCLSGRYELVRKLPSEGFFRSQTS